ncbi:hypothetical protein GQ607_006357 [Colletotrichum asianum]|uniref:Uncharacterized protein n=1 Tax=Colletotrichum asianum TaxID=702518 RepID=A0A8H3WIJ5_9PEZI|nr:hypothetical protein GQ607_006357 [Colletotrichum asianum]
MGCELQGPACAYYYICI